MIHRRNKSKSTNIGGKNREEEKREAPDFKGLRYKIIKIGRKRQARENKSLACLAVFGSSP